MSHYTVYQYNKEGRQAISQGDILNSDLGYYIKYMRDNKQEWDEIEIREGSSIKNRVFKSIIEYINARKPWGLEDDTMEDDDTLNETEGKVIGITINPASKYITVQRKGY
jgi:hypothetical protein